MKRLILLVVLLSGCASVPSEKAAAIKGLSARPLDCQFNGIVSGSSGHWGPGFSLGVRNAQVEALESAARLDATHVQWVPVTPSVFMTAVTGFAYTCPNEHPRLTETDMQALRIEDFVDSHRPSSLTNNAYPPQGGTGTGQSQIQIPNAYGPGLHSDQYGRPVTVQPKY